MHLLATSTPEHKNTVKVLFYGQSITEQDWSKRVADDLRKRFPNANLIIENRAIGGFASQLLVKMAETDLYPFYPDLVIFHVYGSHIEYENIIRRIRERTTAEIVQQLDHVTKDEMLTEETDPAKLSPKDWNAWMNHAFLPSISAKYGTELVDQHNLWKTYLRDNHLHASELLKDGVHLNDHGCFLMAEFVKAHLRINPDVSPSAWADAVKTFEVGKDVSWKGGKLTFPFEGNRVDAICKPGSAASSAVRIDGKSPADFPELYATTRTTSYPRSGWPCLLKTGWEKPRIAETWTLTITDITPDLKTFHYTLEGSKTGPDGEGTSSERFVSKSGRVTIDPDDWNFQYALGVFKKPIEAPFKITWDIKPLYVESFTSPGVSDPAIETVVTLAQGLNGKAHTLEITGGPDVPIAALRVYRPPLQP